LINCDFGKRLHDQVIKRALHKSADRKRGCVNPLLKRIGQRRLGAIKHRMALSS